MDPNRRRRRIGVGGSIVAAGSVWETRMQSDHDEACNNDINVIKPITHLHASDQQNDSNKQIILKESMVNGKRRTLKSDVKIPSSSSPSSPSSLDVSRADSLKLTRPRSNGGATLPVTPRRSIGATPPPTPRRSIGVAPPVTPRKSVSGDSTDKSSTLSVAAKKARSDPVEGVEKTPGRVKKTRSELSTAVVEFDPVALRKVKSLPPACNDSDKKTESVSEVTEEEKVNETEEVKEFGVCQEMIVSANSNEEEQIDNGDHEEEEEEEEEKKSVDVKEMNEEETKSRVSDVEIKKYTQFQNRTAPSPSSVRKIPPPVIKKATSVYSSPPPSKDRFAEEEDKFSHSQSKLQSLVDLVMWRDVSRSTLVFGFGTFLIISSSYAKDLNFSFISVVAYMGLIYLGVMFVFRTLIRRGMVAEEERHKEVGVREEDVKRMLRLIMPYLNESLLQLRALFSGDPSTTLKMGMVLFVLARCGSSITLWNLAKFGFLGAFTMPKIFISYSNHFSAYGMFWLRRFRDAWDTCNHKKAVALALFTLVWNLSSVVARVWAAFMLFVAFRYYQQKMIWTTDQEDDDEEHVVDDDEEEEEEQEEEQVPKLKRASYMMMMPNKLKKIS